MPRKEKIRAFQFTILVVLYTIGTSILIAPNTTAFFAKKDAWMALIINLILGLFLVLFYNKLAKSFQGKDFFQYIDDLLGKWPAKILSALLFIFCFLLIPILLREMADFATIQLFVETPLDVIIGLFIIIVILGARYGIETLARSGEIMFPWFLFLLALLLLLLIPEMKIKNILPMFEEGAKPILLSSYASLSIPYFQLFILLVLIPYVNKQEQAGKAFFTGVLFGGIVIFLITLVSLLVLGGESTARLFFPSYTMAKIISIANIIERLEAFLAAIWFISIYMKISISFYCSVLFLNHVFRVKEEKILMYPLGFILLFLSIYISPNIYHYRNFVGQIYSLYTATYAILLPILLMVIGKIKNRKKSVGQNG